MTIPGDAQIAVIGCGRGSGRVVDVVQPIASLPELQERILGEVFRILAAPCDEVEGLEQPLVLIGDESVEAGPCVDAFGRDATSSLSARISHGCSRARSRLVREATVCACRASGKDSPHMQELRNLQDAA